MWGKKRKAGGKYIALIVSGNLLTSSQRLSSSYPPPTAPTPHNDYPFSSAITPQG
jgi:hypothetical protein